MIKLFCGVCKEEVVGANYAGGYYPSVEVDGQVYHIEIILEGYEGDLCLSCLKKIVGEGFKKNGKDIVF